MSTNWLGQEFTVSQIGRMSTHYFDSKAKALAFAKQQRGGDWVVNKVSRNGRVKRITVIGGHFDDWPGE